MTGRFIVIEGPNGVGKTTAAQNLAAWLTDCGDEVHLTAEPTTTALGKLVRSAEAYLTGRALALAVAADRYAHIDHEIIPALQTGKLVVSHRYVQSSLVLQRLDGLATSEIWSYNSRVMVPDLSVYLEDDPAVIGFRLRQRPGLSRLEQQGSPEQELALYREAHRFLARRGWHQAVIACHGQNPGQVRDQILHHLGPVTGQKRG